MATNFGINLLGAAQSVIGKQAYQIQIWSSRTRNANGVFVDLYDDAVTRHASIQPVSTEKKNMMGLSMTATYINIFDVDLIGILSRSENPPKISYSGYYWKSEPSSMDWNEQGGWNQVTAIRQDKVSP